MENYKVNFKRFKRFKRSAIAVLMASTMMVPFVPGYAAEAGQVQEEVVPVTRSVTKEAETAVSKGDVNGDGLIGLDDVQFILYRALQLLHFDSYEKESACDVDGDGNVYNNDAKLALRHVLDQGTLEGVVSLPIKEMSDITTPKATLQYMGDKKYTYTISVDYGRMDYFDYGVCYDKDKLELVPFDEEENGEWKIYTILHEVLDLEGKVAVGGVHNKEDYRYSGDVVTLTFRAKDGATGTTEITLVPNSAHADEEALANGVKTKVNLDAFSKGDLNGDGLIGLDDIQIILKAALNLVALSEKQWPAVDVDNDGKIALRDAQLVLRHVLDQNTLEGVVGLPIKEMSDIPTPQVVLNYIGDMQKYAYTISVDNADMKYFDYAVCYDKDKLELVPFNEGENGEWKYQTKMNEVLALEGKAVVGGVHSRTKDIYSGDVVTLYFRAKDGAIGTTEITLVPNSAHTDEEALANGVKTQVNLDAANKGDVNDDGLIGLDDVQLIIKRALNLIQLDPEQQEVGDVDNDGKIALRDAQRVLRHVLDQSTLEGVVSLPIKEMSDIPTPKAALQYMGDKKYTYTISVDNANMKYFDYGVYYDKDVFDLLSVSEDAIGKWSEEFQSAMATEFVMVKDVVSLEGEVAVGGVHIDNLIYSGDVVTLTFRAKDGATGTTEITLVPNSAHADEEALANGVKTQVDLDANLVQSDKVTETVSNEDGTVTEKVTETETQPDGTISQTVTETTEKSDGSTEEKVTETIINANGEKETTSEKTVITNKDGSTQEEEIRKLRDEIGNLVTIIEQMKKTTEDIYERLTTTEKLLADATKQIKKVAESSAVDAQGKVVKKTDIIDEKQDANGTSTEKYEYSTDALSQDVEWKTSVMTAQEAVQEAEVLKSNGAKDYRIYDISPEINGQKVQVSDGKSVKVSINCSDKKWKSVKVYDFEQKKWIKAVMENGFAVFTAEHFSKYAVAESTDVKGDTNGDGKVTVADAQLALKKALNLAVLNDDEAARADVDGKTGVTLADAQLILKVALNLASFE